MHFVILKLSSVQWQFIKYVMPLCIDVNLISAVRRRFFCLVCIKYTEKSVLK